MAVPAAPAPASDKRVAAAAVSCGYHSGTRYADRGDRGAHVKEIQCLLRDVWGYSIGSSGIDGIFGAATERAVKAFQADPPARRRRQGGPEHLEGRCAADARALPGRGSAPAGFPGFRQARFDMRRRMHLTRRHVLLTAFSAAAATALSLSGAGSAAAAAASPGRARHAGHAQPHRPGRHHSGRLRPLVRRGRVTRTAQRLGPVHGRGRALMAPQLVTRAGMGRQGAEEGVARHTARRRRCGRPPHR
ncbi:peptidoglycan-binding protein [Streptomyces tricolor]|nr:peptidoglycan-binding protein [Streptomyces tricolor]